MRQNSPLVSLCRAASISEIIAFLGGLAIARALG